MMRSLPIVFLLVGTPHLLAPIPSTSSNNPKKQ